jgi:ankyrin repeat protein
MFKVNGFCGLTWFVCVALALFMLSSCSQRAVVIKSDSPNNESTQPPEYLVFQYINTGEASKLDALLKSNPNLVHIVDDDTNYNTPLHIAAQLGNRAIADVLLENGANPLMENSNQFIPAESALQEGFVDLGQYLQEAAKNAQN